jgi:cytochrome c2
MRAVIQTMLVGLSLMALGACGLDPDPHADAKALIGARCGSCHSVPGVLNADGRVGPPLAGIARRQVIAGYFPNSRETMVRWIMAPQSMLPRNAMPNTGLTRDQAEKVADYLYTLDK